MTSRLSYVCRRYLRLNNIKNGFQQFRQESNNLNACHRYYRRALPFIAGNATLAFSIPWFSSAKKEDSEGQKEDKVDEMGPLRKVMVEADRLYAENEVENLYSYLIKYKDEENDEILWRLARAAVDKGKLPLNEDIKKALYYEAFDYIKRALALNDNNFAVHKWYAILLDYTGEYEGNKKRIKNSFEVKEHFLRAIELNPKDATSIHSLGYWCYVFAEMAWYERYIAKTIFATPPTSTFEEALKYFLQAEETEPNFYSMNLLMLGKTYMKLRDAEKALDYLLRCIQHPSKTVDDKKARAEAKYLLKLLGVKDLQVIDE